MQRNTYIASVTGPSLFLYPRLCTGAITVWHQFVIRCKERERLIKYLNEKEIGTIIDYPVSSYLAEAYRYLGFQKGDFPDTE